MVRGQLRGLRGAPARAARRRGRPAASDHLQEAHARLTRIRLFTDPASPEAFRLEPKRLRLRWLFGEQLEWEVRMAVLRWSGDAPTVHACRAVVAVRLAWPQQEEAFLRALGVLIMAGEPPHYSDTFELAAERAGLPVRELAEFAGRPEVQEALEADAAMARGRACPSLELDEAALARLERRPDPSSVAEVLEWAPYPLATVEVAAICGRDVAAVRSDLARVARFEPVGADGFWSRPVAPDRRVR